MKKWLVGGLKSWTVWLGAVVIALPEWWPVAEPYAREFVSPEHQSKLVALIGIVIVLLRIKTDRSLAEKGTL